MFVSTERNVSPVLKKCFSTANSLSGKGKPVLIKTNVSFAVFLFLRIKISLPFCSVRWEWGKIFFHLTQMFLYSVFLSMRMKLSSPLRSVGGGAWGGIVMQYPKYQDIPPIILSPRAQ